MGTNAYSRPSSTAIDLSLRNNTEALLISDMAVNKIGAANDTRRLVVKHSDGTTVRVPVITGTRLNTEAIVGPASDPNTQITFSDDAITLTAGGVDAVQIVEGVTDYVNIPIELRAADLAAGGMLKATAGTGALVVAEADVDYATKEYVDLAVASITLDEFFSDTASDIGGVYKVMDNSQAAAANIVSSAITTNTTTTIYSFATLSGEPGLDRLLKGIYGFHLHLLKTGNKTITIQMQLYKRVLAGTETLIGSSEVSEALTTSSADYDLHMVIDPEVTLLTTDRLVVKVLAISTGTPGSTTVTMEVGGTQDSHFTAPVSAQSLTNIFVPYTGATADVDLGANNLIVGGLISTPRVESNTDLVFNGSDSIKLDGGHLQIDSNSNYSNGGTLSSPFTIAIVSMRIKITPTGSGQWYTLDTADVLEGRIAILYNGSDTYAAYITGGQVLDPNGGAVYIFNGTAWSRCT
jgi:hypothetical protein